MRDGRRGTERATAIAIGASVAVAMLAACKGRAPADQSQASTDEAHMEAKAVAQKPTALTPACASVLTSLAQIAPEQRANALLAACQPCATAPILIERQGFRRTPTYFTELDAAVQACGGFCTKTARTDFLRGMQAQMDDGEPSARPWRVLAEACPAELGWRDHAHGFVGATWFLLERVALTAGRELPGPLATASNTQFPLPAVAAEGRGLELPAVSSAPFALLVPGRLVVTVLAADVMVGRLPWGALTAAGVQVDGQYPGVPATSLPSAIAAAEAAMIAKRMVPSEPPAATVPASPAKTPTPAPSSAPAPTSAALPSAKREDLGLPPLPATPPSPPPPEVISIAAPHGLPARRVAEVIAQMGRPARLLVLPDGSLPEYQLPMVLPPMLLKTPPNGSPRILISDATAIAATAQRISAHEIWGVELALEADSTVDQLAAALTQLHAALGVALVAPPAAPPAVVNPAAKP